jgi:NNP family nitrate/nitrite transporter-like MFS transporter
VAGIVGAGGNVGAVLAGFLMKGTGDLHRTLLILSALVVASSLCALAARFTIGAAEGVATPASA